MRVSLDAPGSFLSLNPTPGIEAACIFHLLVPRPRDFVITPVNLGAPDSDLRTWDTTELRKHGTRLDTGGAVVSLLRLPDVPSEDPLRA